MRARGGMSGWCILIQPLVFGGLGPWILENPSVVLYSLLVQPFPREETTYPRGFPIPAAVHALVHLETRSSVLLSLFTLWSHLSPS